MQELGSMNLEQVCTNLNKLYEAGKLDPVIGRDEEVEQMIQVLSRRTRSVPIILGEHGVGKTSTVIKLVQRIVNGEVPENVKRWTVYQVDVPSILVDQDAPGRVEGRVNFLFEQLKLNRNAILFIDEFHQAFARGMDLNLIELIKSKLSLESYKLIVACTYEDYKRHIEPDGAFAAKLQPIFIEEPDPETCLKILKEIKHLFEEFHGTSIDDEALRACVELSHRYITKQHLPSSAIDVMDQALSLAKLRGSYAKINPLPGSLEKVVSYYTTIANTAEATVLDVAKVVSAKTKIPVSKLTEDEREKLLKLEETLKVRIRGQDHALRQIARYVRMGRLGLHNRRRPIAVFLMVGPSGTGKTETARALAETLFGDEKKIVRLDMTEFMEPHSVSRLIGAPPGYVGYYEGGKLTEEVKRNPYSVILLDEFDKAHPQVHRAFLQVFDDGRMTDGRGITADFRNTIIILTSNFLSKELGEVTDENFDENYSKVVEFLRKALPIEFINRLDGIILYKSLSKETLREICEYNLQKTTEMLERNGIKINYDNDLVDYLMEHGYDPQLGARPLLGVINDIVSKVSDFILTGKSEVSIKVEKGELIFQ